MITRIDRKILLCFLPLTIIPLLVSIVLIYTTSVSGLRKTALRNVSTLASVIGDHVVKFIETKKIVNRNFASDGQIIRFLKETAANRGGNDRAAAQDALSRHIRHNKLPLYAQEGLLAVSILDKHGAIVASTMDSIIGRDDSKRDYFLKTKTNGFFGYLRQSEYFEDTVFATSAAVMDDDKTTLIGAVVNLYSKDALQNMVTSAGHHTTTDRSNGFIPSYYFGAAAKKPLGGGDAPSARRFYDIYIVDKSGHVIYSALSNGGDASGQLLDTEPVAVALAKKSGMSGVYDNANNILVVGSSVCVAELQWTIVIEDNMGALRPLTFAITAKVITLALFTVLAITIISLIFARRLTAPIKQLTAATQSYAKGDTTINVPRTTDDEIGTLITAFNTMCSAINNVTVSRNFFEQILSNISDSVIITNNNDMTITKVNNASLTLLGCPEKDILGAPYSAIEEMTDGNTGIAGKMTGYAFLVQTRRTSYKGNGGRLIPVDVVSFRIRECGHKNHIIDCKFFKRRSSCKDCKGVYIVNVAHNLTKQLAAEAALLEGKLAAEDASRSKSEFLANMSHEIRTPMNAIVGLSHLLMTSNMDKHQQDYHLKTICSASDGLLVLINDILDFSKIEAGMLTLEDIKFNIDSVIKDVVAMLNHDAEAKGLALTCTVSGNMPAAVIGDPNRLRQIVTNLTGNAIKFTNSGSVTITAGVKRATSKHITARFAVTDTGVGIAPEAAKGLFDKFTQADSSTTRTHGGTGLGLSIAKSLSTLMGGKIGVTSNEGEGSTFWFTCVLGRVDTANQTLTAPHAKQNEPLAALSEEERKQIKILLVDDNAINQKVAAHILNKAGFDTTVVNGGEDAIKSAKETVYDVILMDCQMPKMDGYQTTAAIRKMPAPASITTIIAMTANALEGNREKCLAAGMDDYIAKPVKPKQLISLIEKWAAENGLEKRGAS